MPLQPGRCVTSSKERYRGLAPLCIYQSVQLQQLKKKISQDRLTSPERPSWQRANKLITFGEYVMGHIPCSLWMGERGEEKTGTDQSTGECKSKAGRWTAYWVKNNSQSTGIQNRNARNNLTNVFAPWCIEASCQICYWRRDGAKKLVADKY